MDTGTDVISLAPELLSAPYLRGPPWSTASYGGLGAILGHELGHILPDELRLITSLGRALGASAATRAGGEAPFECLSRHLARMASDGDLKFGGRNTSEEYTSDLIGADLALETMRADLAAQGGAAEADAYRQHTREFFVAFAQHFCSFGTDYTSEVQARSDPHPSVRLRVNGVVSEMPEFARAFSCTAGDPMAPAQRCLAW